MDHIPRPQNPGPPLEVPYVVPEDLEYKGEDFWDFPALKGFDLDKLSEGDLDGGSPLRTLGFLQAWGYFGLLIQFFKLAGLNIENESFIATTSKGRKIVRSHDLLDLLRRWEWWCRHLEEPDRRICSAKAIRYLEAVASVSYAMAKIDFRTENPVHGDEVETEASRSLLKDTILFSIQILGEYLTLATDLCTREVDQVVHLWGQTNIIRDRMLSSGWCLSEIDDFVDQQLSYSCLYYLSLMDRRAFGRDHSNCTILRCTLEELDNRTYRTRHSSDSSCDGQCPDIVFERSWSRRISEIVNKDAVPLLTVKESKSGQKLEITVSGSDLTSNEPPKEIFRDRLLERKARFLRYTEATKVAEEIAPFYVCISHVWSDGLGNVRQNALPICQLLRIQRLVNELYEDKTKAIPFWIDTICVPRRYPERHKAIMAMRKIYAQADKVLVLDNYFTQGGSGMDAVEMLMRIRASTWVRRLWTFHEAALANKIYYQFTDGAFASVHLWNQFQIQRRDADRKRMLQDPEQTWLWDPTTWYSWSATASSDEKASVRKRIDSLCPQFEAGLAFLDELEKFVIEAPTEDYKRLAAMTEPLRWRWTSRLKDEAICLSGIFERDVNDIIELSSVMRMKKLISSLRNVPTDILFVNRARIMQDGYRWIPYSFLGGGSKSTLPSTSKAIPTPDGLIARLPSLYIFEETNFSTVTIEECESIWIQADGQTYVVYPTIDMPSLISWNDYIGSEIALLLQEPLEPDGVVRAAAVTVRQRIGGVQRCRFEHLVYVSADDDPEFRQERGVRMTKSKYSPVADEYGVA